MQSRIWRAADALRSCGCIHCGSYCCIRSCFHSAFWLMFSSKMSAPEGMNEKPVSPLSIATDSVAFFTAQLAYAFLIGVPIVAVIVLFQLLKRGGPVLASFLTVSIIAALSALCGIVLKWVADGILERRRIQTAIHVLGFGYWGLKMAWALVRPGHLSASEALKTSTLAFTFLLAASVVALSLLKGGRAADE